MEQQKANYQFFDITKKEKINSFSKVSYRYDRLMNVIQQHAVKIAIIASLILASSSGLVYYNKTTQQKQQHSQEMLEKAYYLAELQQKQETENIKAISETNTNQFKAILSHVRKTQELETDKMIQLYWTMIYINKKSAVDIKKINILTQDNLLKIKSEYTSLIQKLNETYKLSNTKNPDFLIPPSHYRLFFKWKESTENNVIDFTKQTNEYATQWIEPLKDPVALNKFLDENKELIKNRKPFIN